MSKTITEFLSNEYKKFAYYTIEHRSIPSIVDSFKPVQRKIIASAIRIWKSSQKPLKVFQLSGRVASEMLYAHGDMSLNNAIINMVQKFKNNIPLLDEIGQFGSIRVPDAGAPRYIGTKLNEYFYMIYKDFDLVEAKQEEGVLIEPSYFLPIIPMVLVNGVHGVAVAYTSKILPRNPIEVIKQCIKILNKQKIAKSTPYLKVFDGNYNYDSDKNRWIITGNIVKVNATTIQITELPSSMTYEKYENILEDLLNKKVIVDYEDNCKDNVNYTVKFDRNFLSEIIDEDLLKILKLTEYYSEVFNLIDENGELISFDSDVDIIKYFVNFRLSFYTKRKSIQMDSLDRSILILTNKVRFIEAILKKEIAINNIPKNKIIQKLEVKKFNLVDGSYEYLFRMPISSLTRENYLLYQNEIIDKNKEKISISKLTEKSMYLKDLKELEAKLK